MTSRVLDPRAALITAFTLLAPVAARAQDTTRAPRVAPIVLPAEAQLFLRADALRVAADASPAGVSRKYQSIVPCTMLPCSPAEAGSSRGWIG